MIGLLFLLLGIQRAHGLFGAEVDCGSKEAAFCSLCTAEPGPGQCEGDCAWVGEEGGGGCVLDEGEDRNLFGEVFTELIRSCSTPALYIRVGANFCEGSVPGCSRCLHQDQHDRVSPPLHPHQRGLPDLLL